MVVSCFAFFLNIIRCLFKIQIANNFLRITLAYFMFTLTHILFKLNAVLNNNAHLIDIDSIYTLIFLARKIILLLTDMHCSF